MSELIYVAEDDDNIRELVRVSLESYGYKVKAYEEAAPMLEAASEEVPSLILLDIMMPGMDGLEALAKLKGSPATRDVPVIMLTAKTSEVDKVKGLDLGADDYIAKPFGLLEFSARVRAALRRTGTAKTGDKEVVEVGGLRMDAASREVYLDEKPVDLTHKEFELLRILMVNRERVVEREELLSEVWGYDYIGETRTLDMHIKTLRAKLGDHADNPKFIKTVRSVGYKFAAK